MCSWPRFVIAYTRPSNTQKNYYDEHHRELQFEIGSWVWLRLLNRQARTLLERKAGKLVPKYAGPFGLGVWHFASPCRSMSTSMMYSTLVSSSHFTGHL